MSGENDKESVGEKDEGSLRIDLGLTNERADELIRITQSIMDQESRNERGGRTGHVLLNIAGRRDLTDVEKVACVFIFSTKVDFKDPDIPKFNESIMTPMSVIDIGGMPRSLHGMKEKEFIDIERGIAGMIVSPEGIDKYEMATVIMSTLVAILGDMPKDKAMDMCRNMSISFAKMALTGDIRL